MEVQLTDLQKALVQMLSEIAPILDKHNITYYVVAGTLLGAIRHQGFIPWDDDLDISMSRNSYENFIQTASTILPHHYHLETYQNNDSYPYFFAKIYDTRTTLVESKSQPIVGGIYIDIFPLDGISENPKVQIKNIKKIRKYQKLYRRYYAQQKYFGHILNRILYYTSKPIIRFFYPKKYIFNIINKITSEFDCNNSKMINNYFGSWKEKEIHERIWYQDRIRLKFNGIEVWGPKLYDKVLHKMYGNYMVLPPFERRVSHHNFSHLDLHLPYAEYKKKITSKKF